MTNLLTGLTLASIFAPSVVSVSDPYDEGAPQAFSETFEFEVGTGEVILIPLPGIRSVTVENKGTWALDVWIKWIDATGHRHRTWGGLITGGRTGTLTAPGPIVALCIASTAGPGNGCVTF